MATASPAANAAEAQPPLIAIDTMVFVYQLEASPVYQPIVEAVFASLARGDFHAVTSAVTLMEVAVLPIRLGYADIADQYEAYLLSYPNLSVVNVDRHVARRAADVRATHRVRPADALQLATGLVYGAACFLTNDRALTHIPGMQVLRIDSFLDTAP